MNRRSIAGPFKTRLSGRCPDRALQHAAAPTLDAVVDVYGVAPANRTLIPRSARQFTAEDKRALVAFLHALGQVRQAAILEPRFAPPAAPN